jgi:hypothetical protein
MNLIHCEWKMGEILGKSFPFYSKQHAKIYKVQLIEKKKNKLM